MEYFDIFMVARGQTYRWNFPFSGSVVGVYADAPVDIDIEIHGQTGHITEGSIYEPHTPIDPADVSSLHITAGVDADAKVTIRWIK